MEFTVAKIDASNKTLGRLASMVAIILRGKHLPNFNPTNVPSVRVVVENASHIRLSGSKREVKVYYRFSGYPGGLKSEKIRELIAEDPGLILRKAVKNMLPKNKLRDRMLRHLVVKA